VRENGDEKSDVLHEHSKGFFYLFISMHVILKVHSEAGVRTGKLVKYQ